MSRNFYYCEKRIEERQHEITQGLKIRNLLKSAEPSDLTLRKVGRVILRIIPATVVILILMLRNL